MVCRFRSQTEKTKDFPVKTRSSSAGCDAYGVCVIDATRWPGRISPSGRTGSAGRLEPPWFVPSAAVRHPVIAGRLRASRSVGMRIDATGVRWGAQLWSGMPRRKLLARSHVWCAMDRRVIAHAAAGATRLAHLSKHVPHGDLQRRNVCAITAAARTLRRQCTGRAGLRALCAQLHPRRAIARRREPEVEL
jgi:hypothetical protein